MEAIVIVALVIAFAVCVTPGVMAWHTIAMLESRAVRRRPRIKMRRAF
jgi:hypothetical protein